MRSSWSRVYLAAALLGFALAGCGDSQGPVDSLRTGISISPAGPIPLKVGERSTVTAIITGVSNAAVIYTSDKPAIATIDATTGVLTGVSVGTATIVATSTALPTLRMSVLVIVSAPASAPTASLSIQSVTDLQGQQVDIGNVQGQINVNLTIDVPVGAVVDTVQVLIDDVVVCSQAFTSSTAVAGPAITTDAAFAPVSVTCPVNTAAANAGDVAFMNGAHRIVARVRTGGKSILAAPGTPLIFNNTDYLAVAIRTSVPAGKPAGNGPRSLDQSGSMWFTGDVIVDVVPVIYTAGGDSGAAGIARAAVTLTTSGLGVSGSAGCQTTFNRATDPTIARMDGGAGPVTAGGGVGANNGGRYPNCAVATAVQADTDAANGWSVTFPKSMPMSAGGVSGVEDVIGVSVQTVTHTGQPGPACINPDPARNPQNPRLIGGVIVACGLGLPQPVPNTQGTLPPGDYFRLDNLGPRTHTFDITPARLGCAPTVACYVNDPGVLTGQFVTSDYGVDSQSAVFVAGTSEATLKTINTAFGAGDETATSTTNLLAATATDALGNTLGRVFPTANPAVTAQGAGTAQRFGIDVTAPSCDYADDPDDEVVIEDEINPLAGEVFRTEMSDAAAPGAGPSGFGTNPVLHTQQRITEDGTECLVGTSAGCDPVMGGVDDPVATSREGYVVESVTVRDIAGNTCDAGERTALLDSESPIVGGIVLPTELPGNEPAIFMVDVTDNLDLEFGTGWLTYGSVIETFLLHDVGLGEFGTDELTTAITVPLVAEEFIRSIETTTFAGAPSGFIQQATTVEVEVNDAAGNYSDVRSQNLQPTVSLSGTDESFTSSAPLLQSFTVETDDPDSLYPVLIARATGPGGTFGNPFERVNFYATTPFGYTVFVGTGTVSARDSNGQRSWIYILDELEYTGEDGLHEVFALGIDADGRGLQSNLISQEL